MSDVIVIGGGPAGSLVALLLARAGWEVTLVEQSRFPRDKVCGECLSALGQDVLRRCGLLERLVALGPVSLTRVHLHAGERSVPLKLPRPMLGVTRRALDAFLLDAAAEAGAIVLQPARCEALIDGTTPRVRLRDLVQNQTVELSASRVIVADGKASLPGDRPPQTGDFGVKAHFTDVDGARDAIELFGCHGCYGGLAAVEGGRWNASFSVPAARLRTVGGDRDRILGELMSENRSLCERLGRARRVSEWLASPLPRFAVRAVHSANVIHVGNGSAAMEPIGGEGMGVALRSAELAAAWLNEGGGSGKVGRYAAQAASLWRVRRPACRAAAIVASSPAGARLALALLSGLDLGNMALRVIGK